MNTAGLSKFSLNILDDIYSPIFTSLGTIIQKYPCTDVGEIFVKLLSQWYFHCSNKKEKDLIEKLILNAKLDLKSPTFRTGLDQKDGGSFGPLSSAFYQTDFRIITTEVTNTLKYTIKEFEDLLNDNVKLSQQCSDFKTSGIKSALYATYGYLEYTKESDAGMLRQLPGHLILSCTMNSNDLKKIAKDAIFITLLAQSLRLGLPIKYLINFMKIGLKINQNYFLKNIFGL